MGRKEQAGLKNWKRTLHNPNRFKNEPPKVEEKTVTPPTSEEIARRLAEIDRLNLTKGDEIAIGKSKFQTTITEINRDTGEVFADKIPGAVALHVIQKIKNE